MPDILEMKTVEKSMLLPNTGVASGICVTGSSGEKEGRLGREGKNELVDPPGAVGAKLLC